MPHEPLVQFVVTLALAEDGTALAGEVGVVVSTEKIWSEQLDRSQLEVPADMALRNALNAARTYLEVRSASNGDPTPTQPRRPARKRASSQVKGSPAMDVSRSRLR